MCVECKRGKWQQVRATSTAARVSKTEMCSGLAQGCEVIVRHPRKAMSLGTRGTV